MEIFDDVFSVRRMTCQPIDLRKRSLVLSFWIWVLVEWALRLSHSMAIRPFPPERRAHNNKSQVNTITAALSRDGMFDYRLDAKTFQCSLNNLFGRQHTIELQNIFDESRAFKVVNQTRFCGNDISDGLLKFRISLNSNRL